VHYKTLIKLVHDRDQDHLPEPVNSIAMASSLNRTQMFMATLVPSTQGNVVVTLSIPIHGFEIASDIQFGLMCVTCTC